MSAKSRSQNDLYQAVTDRIVAALEAGTAPWIRPWKQDRSGGHMPHNAVSARGYHGVNVLLLMLQEQAHAYPTAGWLTYAQAVERGGHVRVGEKGTEVIFWRFLSRQATDGAGNPVLDGDGNAVMRSIPMLRTYYVFNVAQCADLELPARRGSIAPIDATEIDAIIARTGADIRHGGDVACYSTFTDAINIPNRAAFCDLNHYHATLLHEITHWTGHPDRCNRSLEGRFGSQAYAAEELIAEMGSAFLCGALGVPLEELQHPAYLAMWIQVLKADNRAIFTAAKAAQTASDWILARAGFGAATDVDIESGSDPLAIAA